MLVYLVVPGAHSARVTGVLLSLPIALREESPQAMKGNIPDRVKAFLEGKEKTITANILTSSLGWNLTLFLRVKHSGF